ncbi:hypothetical protein N7470_009008 [Penicillium chermesinum]|nr:hypothetical protein N7470_009008 [Penicillium chermesinum]
MALHGEMALLTIIVKETFSHLGKDSSLVHKLHYTPGATPGFSFGLRNGKACSIEMSSNI